MGEREREAELGEIPNHELPRLHADLEEVLLRLVGRGPRWSHHGHHQGMILELFDLCKYRYLPSSSIVM
jgi:hypothetical protein